MTFMLSYAQRNILGKNIKVMKPENVGVVWKTANHPVAGYQDIRLQSAQCPQGSLTWIIKKPECRL